nr:diaminopimelate dehydrogenase [Eubacterium sp.]
MKIAIYGYGNLGHGVEAAAKQNDDVELIGIFTRRNADSVVSAAKTPVYNISEIDKFEKEIDVLIICGGSATDLPKMTPEFAKKFNVVDSFDTHANIPAHYKNVNEAAVSGGNIAIISTGWDPGMFSIARLYSSAILPQGKDYTFWGKGVSQGHSDAIRRIDGVVDARQYTVPVEAALDAVRSGNNPELTTRQKHTRECYVVAEDGADLNRIEKEIKEMPNYFADYDTTVNFISKEEMLRDHSALPHGGSVIRTGVSGLEKQNKHVIEYSLKLDSNPEFTANVLIAFARAINKMHK